MAEKFPTPEPLHTDTNTEQELEKQRRSLRTLLTQRGWIESDDAEGKTLYIEPQSEIQEELIIELLFDYSVYPHKKDNFLVVDNPNKLNKLNEEGFLSAVLVTEADVEHASIEPDFEASEDPARYISQQINNYLTSTESETAPGLRERQIGVLEAIREHLANGNESGYVTLPTGVGKTVIFSKIIAAAQTSTLVTTETRLLVDQTHDTFETFAPDVDAGRLHALSNEIHKPVVITTYASLTRKTENGTLNPDEYNLVIVDEAHKALTEKRKGALDKFPHAVKVGFTATPEYSEKKKTQDVLGTEIYNMHVREACEEGLLSPVLTGAFHTDANMQNVDLLPGGVSYDEESLSHEINNPSRNIEILVGYKSLNIDGKTIVFCSTIQHAHDLAETFQRGGVKAAAISSQTNEEDQKKILQGFHDGDIEVVCNAKLLTIGFDEPRASVCINAAPTRSKVHAEQRAGRVLRLDPDNSEKHSLVIECIDRGYDTSRRPVFYWDILDGVTAGPFPSGKIADTQDKNVLLDPERVSKLSGEIDADVEGMKADVIPEDWVLLDSARAELEKELSLRSKSVQKYVEKYRSRYKKRWFRKNEDENIYVHPEFIGSVKEEIEQYLEKIPEGWKTVMNIANMTGMGTSPRQLSHIRSLLLPYRVAEPDNFKFYELREGVVVEHIHPDIVKNILETFKLEGEAPEKTESGDKETQVTDQPEFLKSEDLEDLGFMEAFRKIDSSSEDADRQTATAIHAIRGYSDLNMLCTYRKFLEDQPALEDMLIEKYRKMRDDLSVNDLSSLKDKAPEKLKKFIERTLKKRIDDSAKANAAINEKRGWKYQ